MDDRFRLAGLLLSRCCLFSTALVDEESFRVAMADDCIQIVAMGDSSGESEEKYEIYEAGSDMFCVIGVDSSKQASSKTQGSKPRYKQSYREAWESMRDFKGWLSSVPGNNSKAYCKLCQKELHCHRLSLLKHKVTFKHQKKEEEQKLSKLRGEKNESGVKKVKDVQNGNTEGSNTSTEPVIFEMEEDNSDAAENVIITKVADSETCNTLFHENKVEEEEEGEVSSPKNGSLTTHILDVSKGVPGALVHLVLYKLIDGRWTLLHEGVTNPEGRYNFDSSENEFSEGRYKLHYDVDKYFEKQNQETIFPFIEVVFDVKDVSTHYHIPLLLSPYGYSTYKGS